jgi:broad specificity phosphatase PhoE
MAASDKMGEVVLYIGRHAEVQKDKEGKMRGLLNDSLDSRGQKQADELAALFRDKPLTAIYVDDLARTRQTAEPIAAVKGIKIHFDTELRSWDIGSELEGKSIEANEEEIKRLKSQPDLIPVGGQSWSSYSEQVRRFFARYWAMGLDSGPILLVLHGSGIQIIWAHLGQMEPGTAYDQTPLEPSGMAAISCGRKGPLVKILRGAKNTADE